MNNRTVPQNGMYKHDKQTNKNTKIQNYIDTGHKGLETNLSNAILNSNNNNDINNNTSHNYSNSKKKNNNNNNNNKTTKYET